MTAHTPVTAPVRSVSYGGGVQSTALLVLAAEGKIDFDLFLFADVGEDSENPSTLRYVRQIAVPYAEANGIDLRWVSRKWMRGERKGVPETLWGRLTKDGSRSLPIPVRMSNGAPGTRSCTADFKIAPIGRELKRLGATVENPAIVALGISVDEIERAKPGIDEKAPYRFRVYPLLDLGLRRSDCREVISGAGLPVPDKSACFFCPFHDLETWRTMAREDPRSFERAVWLERHLAERRLTLGKDEVFFTRFGRPLTEVVDVDQGVLDLGLDGCDSGWCMT